MNRFGHIASKISQLGLGLCFSLIINTHVQAQSVQIDEHERKAVVEQISELLIENYVFKDVGTASAAFIRQQWTFGKYDSLITSELFSARLTRDLQSVSHDKHLHVSTAKVSPLASLASWLIQENDISITKLMYSKLLDTTRNSGFQKVEILGGNVGYIEFKSFGHGERPQQIFTNAMTFMADTDAMIIDLRQNGGGSIELLKLIASFFLHKKPSYLTYTTAKVTSTRK